MTDGPELPMISESSCGDVPVFNCVVLIRHDADSGQYSGRVANLEGITARGATERDVLFAVTRQFKQKVQERVRAGEKVCFITPPLLPESDEFERFVPIHL
jgi:hypothetical protein